MSLELLVLGCQNLELVVRVGLAKMVFRVCRCRSSELIVTKVVVRVYRAELLCVKVVIKVGELSSEVVVGARSWLPELVPQEDGCRSVIVVVANSG